MKIEEKNLGKIKKILEKIEKKTVPLYGSSRSFSCVSSKRKWNHNKQKVNINGKVYNLSPKIFKKISKQLNYKI